MMLSGYLYDAEGHDREVAVGDALPPLADQQLLWSDCDAPDAGSLAALARLLGLPPVLAEQLGTNGSDTLETYGRFFRLRVATAAVLPDTDPLPSGRQTHRAAWTEFAKLPRGSVWGLGAARRDLLVGPDWLASMRDGDVAYPAAFREQDKVQTPIGVLSPALLVASLLNWIAPPRADGLHRFRLPTALAPRRAPPGGARGKCGAPFRGLRPRRACPPCDAQAWHA